jgi:Zn-dependent protease with chaperone function
MAKAWLVLIISVLGAPLLGLSVASIVNDPSQAVLLRRLCITALVLTAALPTLYVLLAFALSRSRDKFARYFPTIVRGALFALVGLLALQGSLTLLTAYDLATASQGSRFMLLLAAGGFGFLFAAFLVLNEGRKLFEPPAISVTGVEVNEHRLPELRARVNWLAARLNAKAPDRIVLGLEPTCFVTSAAISLRGQETQAPAQTTMFLSTLALRVLDEDEIDAVLGHELGHFRGGDLAFSQRFAPAYLSLTRALESVGIDHEGDPAWVVLPILPAVATLSGMMYVLHRAVSGISRRRELEADRAAVEVTPVTALVTALIKMQAVSPYWDNARRENAAVVSQGRFRRNLAMDYLQGVRNLVQNTRGSDAAVMLAESRTAHPLDTHPTLFERAQALDVHLGSVVASCYDSLRVARDHEDALGVVEQELTCIENEFVRPPAIAPQGFRRTPRVGSASSGFSGQ